MVILGIDPGTASTGYGVIKNQNELKVVDYGCIKTSPQFPTADRLKEIHQKITELIKKHKPDIVAIEDIFFFKNTKTVIKVSQAQGAIILTAAQMKIPVVQYTPLQVKQAVTSYGRADKNQVQRMVKILLQLKEIPNSDHAADALAIAICCANSLK